MQLCIEFQLRVLRSFWVKSPENMWLLFTVFSFIEITSSVYNTTLTFLFCKISSFLLGNQYFTPYLTPFISFDDICIQYLSRLQCHSFGSKQTHVRLDAHLVAMTTTCKQCVNAGMAIIEIWLVYRLHSSRRCCRWSARRYELLWLPPARGDAPVNSRPLISQSSCRPISSTDTRRVCICFADWYHAEVSSSFSWHNTYSNNNKSVRVLECMLHRYTLLYMLRSQVFAWFWRGNVGKSCDYFVISYNKSVEEGVWNIAMYFVIDC